MGEETKSAGKRYLELIGKLARVGEWLTEAEADVIYVEMRSILAGLDTERRKDLILVGENERRRMLRRTGESSAVPELPFKFLCRIPRSEVANYATEKLGPGWLSSLLARGICLPFKEIVVVNPPDGESDYQVWRVEAGRIF